MHSPRQPHSPGHCIPPSGAGTQPHLGRKAVSTTPQVRTSSPLGSVFAIRRVRSSQGVWFGWEQSATHERLSAQRQVVASSCPAGYAVSSSRNRDGARGSQRACDTPSAYDPRWPWRHDQNTFVVPRQFSHQRATLPHGFPSTDHAATHSGEFKCTASLPSRVCSRSKDPRETVTGLR